LSATASHSGKVIRVVVGSRFGLGVCVRIFADAARRLILAVCTAFSANRPLVDRPDITCWMIWLLELS